jgi:dTDP-4-amino-4,6-dideoxygalactose transaminase
MKVPFLDLKGSFTEIQDEIESAMLKSVRSGQYIGGDSLQSFEREFQSFVDSDYCVGVANGLDALVLSLKVLGVGLGDEVIVPSNTFIATWLAVTQCGAIPVPIEPHVDTYNIDASLIAAKITDRTKVIIPVHLYGQPADLEEIINLARSHNLYVVEDAAQAHGASYKGRKIGSHGDLVTWSFYPGKNLGALGDGGAITTNNKELAERLRVFRNYGSSERYVHSVLGSNSRLDSVQAAVLSVKLKHLSDWNQRRVRIASIYNEEFKDLPIILPKVRTYNDSVWHLYCIRIKNRDEFRKRLSLRGIETLVHYPIPPHLQDAYRFLNFYKNAFPLAESIASELISLPIGPSLTEVQVAHVVNSVKSLFTSNI